MLLHPPLPNSPPSFSSPQRICLRELPPSHPPFLRVLPLLPGLLQGVLGPPLQGLQWKKLWGWAQRPPHLVPALLVLVLVPLVLVLVALALVLVQREF